MIGDDLVTGNKSEPAAITNAYIVTIRGPWYRSREPENIYAPESELALMRTKLNLLLTLALSAPGAFAGSGAQVVIDCRSAYPSFVKISLYQVLGPKPVGLPNLAVTLKSGERFHNMELNESVDRGEFIRLMDRDGVRVDLSRSLLQANNSGSVRVRGTLSENRSEPRLHGADFSVDCLSWHRLDLTRVQSRTDRRDSTSTSSATTAFNVNTYRSILDDPRRRARLTEGSAANMRRNVLAEMLRADLDELDSELRNASFAEEWVAAALSLWSPGGVTLTEIMRVTEDALFPKLSERAHPLYCKFALSSPSPELDRALSRFQNILDKNIAGRR